MKDKLKKMLCILTAASVIAALAACGGKDPDSASVDEPVSASETARESDTVKESDTAKDSASESKPESNPESNSESTPESNSESEKPAPELKIVSPEGVVYPYIDIVKNYLESDKGVEEFYEKVGNAYAPVTIEWKNTYENAESVKVEYSVNEDMTNAEETELEGYKTKLNLYNLLKGTKYYVRVTAKLAGGEEKTAVSSFETTDLGARFMKIDGIFNVRDLGGYKTADGETTLQNMFFRGGALSPEINGWYDYVKLSDSGKKYMSETLGIKTDFDLRSAKENLGLTESPIPGANLEYYEAGGYLSAFTGAEAYRKIFSALSDKSRYPVYLHCTGGADRTGTVSFLVNALLGVDERTLIQDYELTSFSIYELRNYNSTVYQFKDFVERLKTYEGDTLQEKTENYLLSIGVTETEIYNIKAIMLGKQTRTSVKAQESFTSYDETYTITLGNASGLTKVLISGEEVNYELNGNVITIARADMPKNLTDGTVNGKLVIDGEEYDFSFICDNSKRVSALPEGTDEITLNSSLTSQTGKTIIGYDGTIAELNVKSVTTVGDGYGGSYFFIGSYGFHYRSGEFRVAIINNGNFAEPGNNRVVAGNYSATLFNAGVKFGMSVTIKDENTVTLKTFANDKLIFAYDKARVSDEIASDKAVFAVEIEPSHIGTFVISGVAAEKKIVLDSSNTRADGDTVIGYNGAIASVEIASVVDKGSGGTYFMIGSYGVYFRGDGFRFAIINSDGNFAEYSPRTQIKYSNATFKAGVKFGLAITIKDADTITVSVYINDALLGEYDVPRSANEISGNNAKFSIEITDNVTSLTINGGL